MTPRALARTLVPVPASPCKARDTARGSREGWASISRVFGDFHLASFNPSPRITPSARPARGSR